mgnify:CR=1 FL=1|tara:strand:- start:8174 stop:9994 length:1821 start_codon:yes stop_codon:yes gene_type:complete
MAIKIYETQKQATNQSSFVKTPKLDRNFGQDAFEGIKAFAEGVNDVGEFFAKKLELNNKNKRDEAIVKSKEELIQFESLLNDPNGEYAGVDENEKTEIFLKKRQDIIEQNTLGFSNNLKLSTQNLYNANTLQDVSRVTNNFDKIIIEKALGSSLRNINTAIEEINYTDTKSVLFNIDSINNEIGFIEDNMLMTAQDLLVLTQDTSKKMLLKALETIAPYENSITTTSTRIVDGEEVSTEKTQSSINFVADEISIDDFNNLLAGTTEHDIVSPILNLLNNDDEAYAVYHSYIKRKIDEETRQRDLIQSTQQTWLFDNKDLINDLNSNDYATRVDAFKEIEKSYYQGYVSQTDFDAYKKKFTDPGVFAVQSDTELLFALENEFANSQLTHADLENKEFQFFDRDGVPKTINIKESLTKGDYDDFYNRISNQQNRNLARAKKELYNSFNIEVGLLDKDDLRHVAISSTIRETENDMIAYLNEDFDELKIKYGEDVENLGFASFKSLAIKKAKEDSVSIRQIAFIEFVDLKRDTIPAGSQAHPDYINVLLNNQNGEYDFDVNNVNEWYKKAQSAAEELRNINPAKAQEIMRTANTIMRYMGDYKEFFEGF